MEGVSDTDRTVWGLEEELVSGGLLSLDIWICWVTNCTHRDQSALDFLTVPHIQGPVSTGLLHSASYTGTSQRWTASQCLIHRDQSALDCLTVPHTQGPVSTGLPHSASYTGTSQHWTASQCLIHRDQSALDCLTVPHTQGPVSTGLPHSASYTGTSQHWTASQCIIHIYRDWSVVVTSGDNTYRDWSVVVTHTGAGQWW